MYLEHICTKAPIGFTAQFLHSYDKKTSQIASSGQPEATQLCNLLTMITNLILILCSLIKLLV